MKHIARFPIRVFFMVTVFLAGAALADYTIDWYTLDGGGNRSSGGSFEVVGTVGQVDAGPAASPMSGGSYEIIGGFWTWQMRPPVLQGDINGDGCVNLPDVLLLAQAWGTCAGDPDYNPDADFNGDDCVNLPDLLILASHWGECL